MTSENVYIYAIGISEDQLSKIREIFKSVSSSIHIFDFEVHNNIASKDSVFLLDVSTKYDKSTLKSYPVILYCEKETKVSTLKKFLKVNVIDIIDAVPSLERAKGLFLKISINLLFHQNIPFKALEHITRSSIKVKSHEQLNDFFETYFNFFEKVNFKSFFIVENDEFRYLHGEKSRDIESFVKNTLLSEKFIGTFFEFKNYCLIPVNKDKNRYSWVCIETKENLETILVDLLFIHLQRIELYRSLKGMSQDLLELSLTDEVTGLYNQRKLTDDLKIEVNRCEKEDINFSLLFVDIDHFKKVNDNHGHIVGSNMLKQLGEVLKGFVRATDSVYRYGGDEFIVLMRKTKTETVYQVATRILEKIKKTNFIVNEQQNYKLSVSIGIAEFPKDASCPKQIVEFADKMMYKSKDSGRGKIFHVKEVS